MSKHPPHTSSTPNPTDPAPVTGADPSLIDLVAGDPPVPITVWRTARTATDPADALPSRLAYRLIAAYSRPGDIVIDLTEDHALTTACTTGSRDHHPAWFTGHDTLTIGSTTPAPVTTACDRGSAQEPSEVGAWFGDDLTDPSLPPHADGGDQASEQDTTSLVVARWPLEGDVTGNQVPLARLLAVFARLLRPGGCLVLVVGVPAGATATPQDFTPLVTAAGGAGLGYLQHIVAVTADTGIDTFVYHVTDEELLTLARTSVQQWTMQHLRVHTDLLVFSKPPATAAGRKAGGRRG